MKKEMLINVLQPEECRIAIVEDGVLEELYVERTSHESYVGNIYKGRIVNIEPSIQAAFVDFGVGRNGFLHVSDVEPTYYRHLLDPRDRARGRDRGRGGDEESIYDYDDLGLDDIEDEAELEREYMPEADPEPEPEAEVEAEAEEIEAEVEAEEIEAEVEAEEEFEQQDESAVFGEDILTEEEPSEEEIAEAQEALEGNL